jgi:protein subunit release factor B
MAKSQHTFSKREREKAKQKKVKDKMERREERKHERNETESNGPEIDWGSAPTEKTLEKNNIKLTDLEKEDMIPSQPDKDE